MRYTWFLSFVVVIMAAAAFGVQYDFNVHLKVVDCNGEPVPEFEVAVFTHASGFHSWKEGTKGEIMLRGGPPDFLEDRSTNYHFIVRSKNHASYILEVNNPKGDIEQIVKLQKGRRVEIILDSSDERPIPDSLVPIVIFPQYQDWVWLFLQTYDNKRTSHFDLNLTSLVQIKPGHYAFDISNDLDSFYIFIDHPGFLRAFKKGPFSMQGLANGRLKIKLPKPARLEVTFDPPENLVENLPYAKCRVGVFKKSCESKTHGFPIATITSKSPKLSYQENCAPGNYWVILNTEPEDNTIPYKEGQPNPAYFQDMKEFLLSEGQIEKGVFTYSPYDENAYKGDYGATVDVRWQDGKPASGLSYVLNYNDKNFGPINIKEGTVAADGTIELTGLKGGKDGPSFTLEIGKGRLGRHFIQLDDEEKHRVLEYRIVPKEGDIAPDISLLDVFSGKKVKLSDYKGKVIFIEFWSTWCGPCQGPMAHLCRVSSRRKDDWAGKVAIWGISIDEKKENVASYVRSRGWLGVRHLWCDEGESRWKSDAAKTYGIMGIPTALLIDQSGYIVWRGHPEEVDLEARIDQLLKIGRGK